MADENEIDPATQTETDTPAAPAPSAIPDDIKATLENAKRLVEETRREREQTQQTHATYLRTIQALTEDKTPAAVDDLPEVDEPVAKRIKLEVSRANDAMAKQFTDAYTKDRSEDMAYRAQIEEERLTQRFSVTDADLKRELKAEIEQLPVHLRARPDVLDVSYYAVKGRRAHEAEQAEARRSEAASVASSDRSRAGGFVPSFTQDDLNVARRVDPTMTDRELELFSSGRPVSIDDYRAAKAAGGKK